MKNLLSSKKASGPISYKINPELKTVPEVVKFLEFFTLNFVDRDAIPVGVQREIDELLKRNIIIVK